jgi:hypothetical protein
MFQVCPNLGTPMPRRSRPRTPDPYRDPQGRFLPGHPGRRPGFGSGRDALKRLSRDLGERPVEALERMQRNPVLQVKMLMRLADRMDPALMPDVAEEQAHARWDNWNGWRAGHDLGRFCLDRLPADHVDQPVMDGPAEDER